MIIKGLILMTIAIAAIITKAIIHHRLCTRYSRKFEELHNMYNNLDNAKKQLGDVIINKTNWHTIPIINEDEIYDKCTELRNCLFDIRDKLYNINAIRNVARLENNFRYTDDVPYLQQFGDVELQLANASALAQTIGCYLSEA